MPTKKRILSQIKKEDLQGFEEFIDGIEDSFYARSSSSRSKDSSPEMLTYLENDSKRLTKIHQFFHQKFQNSIKHPSTESLVIKQKQLNERFRESLVKRVENLNSTFQKNLERIFNAHFKE